MSLAFEPEAKRLKLETDHDSSLLYGGMDDYSSTFTSTDLFCDNGYGFTDAFLNISPVASSPHSFHSNDADHFLNNYHFSSSSSDDCFSSSDQDDHALGLNTPTYHYSGSNNTLLDTPPSASLSLSPPTPPVSSLLPAATLPSTPLHSPFSTPNPFSLPTNMARDSQYGASSSQSQSFSASSPAPSQSYNSAAPLASSYERKAFAKAKAPMSPGSPFYDEDVDVDLDLRVNTLMEFHQRQDDLAKMTFSQFSRATEGIPEEQKKDQAFKTLAKRIKNREAARKSRKRSREKMESTKNHKKVLEKENMKFKSDLEELRRNYELIISDNQRLRVENDHLHKQLHDLQSTFRKEVAGRIRPKHSNSSTVFDAVHGITSSFEFPSDLIGSSSDFGLETGRPKTPIQRTQMVSLLLFLLFVCVSFTVFTSGADQSSYLSISPLNTNKGRVLFNNNNGNANALASGPALAATGTKMIADKPAFKRFAPSALPPAKSKPLSGPSASAPLPNKIKIADTTEHTPKQQQQQVEPYRFAGNETLICSPRDEAVVEIIDQKTDSISFLVKTAFLNQTMNMKIPVDFDTSQWSSVTCTNFVVNIFPTVDISQPLPSSAASTHSHDALALN
eukprot:TRINITY_DN1051_c0_g1_i2.p1 TRINITY_DN1051_c0_g1~~TRINITY_DN1051_c0_g1_i2.p1  ORF type:complete len:618 (+),score=310.05 TRINITY_DN1051_c0_g1_i2:244-2097(+)